MTAPDVLDATRWVTPALEILDARVQMSDPETGHLRTIVDTISDNAADAGIVTGGRAVRPDACDLRRVAAVLYLNEAIEETGVAAGVLGLRLAMPAQAANVVSLLLTAVANTAANRRLTFGISGRLDAARHQVKGLIAFGLGLALTAGSGPLQEADRGRPDRL